jgi:protein tyrosine phosphatase (PTP) superfamily phosphohydrolase (DUF442 family)
LFGIFLAIVLAAGAQAQDDLLNYREYSPTLASSGQPTLEQLQALPGMGFERVVYLALSDQDRAVPNEDRVVRETGLEFVHLPIIWMEPTADDFALFAAVMNQGADRKTLVHCQVNWRASSFVFLWRVIHGGVPIDDAVVDLNAVWEPQPHWSELIVEVLTASGIDPNCDLCNWRTE